MSLCFLKLFFVMFHKFNESIVCIMHINSNLFLRDVEDKTRYLWFFVFKPIRAKDQNGF